MTKNYYTILSEGSNTALGLHSTSSEIKKAYNKLALKHHPDKGGDEDKFKTYLQAYEVLSNPIQRAEHDATLGGKFSGPHTRFISKSDPDADFSNETGDEANKIYNEREKIFSTREYDYFTELLSQEHKNLSSNTLSSFKHNGYGIFEHNGTKKHILVNLRKLFGDIFDRDNNIEKSIFLRSIYAVKRYVKNMLPAYPNSRRFLFDLCQPIRAIELFVLSLSLILAFLVPVIIFSLVQFFSFIRGQGFKEWFVEWSSVRSLCYNLLSGLALLLSTPLTWFVTMPIRGIRTLLSGWGPVEERDSMKQIIKEAYEGIDREDKSSIIITCTLLHKKYMKAFSSGEYCRNTKADLEGRLYEKVDKDFVLGTLNIKSSIPLTKQQKIHVLDYLSFFKKSDTDMNAMTITPSPMS